MIVGSTIVVRWDELTRRKRERLERALTFVTPKGQVVECFRTIQGVKMVIPRGAWHFISQLDYSDRRTKPLQPRLDFKVKLDDVGRDERFAGQREAVEAILEYEQGLVIRPPGTGKTQIALAFAAECQTSVLVLVHTKDILEQWLAAIQTAIPSATVGVIQGKKESIGQITVAMVQTIGRFIEDGKHDDWWWDQFGAAVLDEAHHGAAKMHEQVLNYLACYYRIGFTASPTRADGMHPYLVHLIGPVIHKQKFSSPIDLEVLPKYTKFEFPYRGGYDWEALLNALVRDEGRNKRIGAVIDREVSKGNSVLVLSRRVEHLDRIAEFVNSSSAQLVASRVSDGERARILRAFKAGEVRCLFATQLADEALDVPRCNRVILTYPGKAEGRLIQQVGRTLRAYPDKENARVIDFVDKRVRPLRYQWSKRRMLYRREKIHIRKRKRRTAID